MGTTVIKHTGKKGVAGRDGTDGLTPSDVRASLIESTALNLFRANNIDPAISWTRDSEATFVDRYGEYSKINGDTVEHLLANSQEYEKTALTFDWQDPDGIWTRNTDQVESDPLGGTEASQITFTSTTGQTFGFVGNIVASLGVIYRVSIYVKVISGTLNKISYQHGSAGTIVDFPQTPDGTWQRFSLVYSGQTSSEARFLFDAPSGCVVHVFGANVTTGTKLHEYRLIGDARPQTFDVDAPVYRENDRGYLIEGSKTNLAPYSQDLSQWSTTGSPTISANPSADAFGDIGQNTLVTFGANTSITVFESVTLTSGTTYAVSFFAVASSGSVENLSVSLGGGTAVTCEVTDDYTRQELFVTAGSNNTISFNASTGTSGTAFILGYIQIETGQHSSYIPTVAVAETRPADTVVRTGADFPALNRPFTVQVSWRDAEFVATESYLFELVNGISCYLDLNNGDKRFAFLFEGVGGSSGLAAIGARESMEAIVTWDGVSTMSVYYDGEFWLGDSNNSATYIQPTEMIIGALDAAGSGALNASIKCLRAWPFEMTANEVKFISEVYNGNRYSDLG